MLSTFEHPVAYCWECSCAKFEIGQTSEPTTPNISLVRSDRRSVAQQRWIRLHSSPNIVGATHAHFTWFTKIMGCILPTMHCRSQLASVCATLPTQTKQLPTLFAHWCWELFFDCFDCCLFKFSCVHCRYLFRPYSKHVCSGVNVIWALFVVIGISSAYFHATLSLVGQLLDELAILWGVMLAFALWTPKWMLTLGPIVVDRYGSKYKLKCCCLSSCLFNFFLLWGIRTKKKQNKTIKANN